MAVDLGLKPFGSRAAIFRSDDMRFLRLTRSGPSEARTVTGILRASPKIRIAIIARNVLQTKHKRGSAILHAPIAPWGREAWPGLEAARSQ